jgi:hypothetical protein
VGQNASERAFRSAVLASPVRDFDGYRPAVDCGNPACGGERIYNVTDLARLYGNAMLIGRVVIRLRCRVCGEAARSCFIETGAELAQRGRMRRVALVGREKADPGR